MKHEQDIFITDADRERLRALVERLRDARHVRDDHVAALAERVRHAGIVSPKDVPRNVVTLNSQVSLRDLDSGARVHCTLSDPFDVGVFGNRLSVTGPAGTALLGRRVGQIIRWPVGARERRYRIEQIPYQPEAAGDFHL
jgi:regulator of nucleoside diphosphate kinase